jgi:PAS domain S-box-containing protein
MASHSRILVVDDEPRMCETLKVLLEERGFEVEALQSGADALTAVRKRQFDLFLFDVCMPEVDGFRLVEETIQRQPETPVIMITGNASVESAIRALKIGAYDYLRKPFEPQDLVKTVNNALEQKRLKEENRAITDQLILSERRYRYLVHNSPDLIYTLDNEGRFTFVNKAFEKLLGYGTHDLVGESYFSVVHEDDHEKARSLFEEMGRCGACGAGLRLLSCHDHGKSRECQVRHMTIELKATKGSDHLLNGDQKKPLATHGVARDVSYRKHLECKLRQAQKMEAIGTLAGAIAHDFNNILMEIQGYTSLLLRDCEDAAGPVHKRLKSIENHVLSGSELTRQILGFARAGRLNLKPLDLNDLLKRTASLFEKTKEGICITASLQDPVWFAEADEGQIKQVLLNLYVNAWQAMPNGGKIHLETQNIVLTEDEAMKMGLAPGRHIKLSVSDNGIGMDKAVQQRIFEPFFTTKKRRRGTGLGLASAYRIVKNHGGGIEVLSEKGKGTTFAIYLPAAKSGALEDDVNSQQIRESLTVLLIEDKGGAVEVAKEMLKSMGCRVITAKSGPEAVDVFAENRDAIDLVIADMMLPGMKVRTTFDHIKSLNREVKVLLSTGYGLKDEAKKSLRSRCEGFIQKPFSLEELSEKINSVFRQQKAS